MIVVISSFINIIFNILSCVRPKHSYFIELTATAMEKKAACVVVVCCLLIHVTVIGSDVILYHTAGSRSRFMVLILQGVVYLLYPFLGWLSDVCITRYRSVLFSFIIMIVGSIPMIIAATLYALTHHFAFMYIAALSIVIGVFGLGLFESTAIQFGMDQMLEASSEQLSTFIHWYYWSSSCGRLAIEYIVIGVLDFYSQCNVQEENLTYGYMHRKFQHTISTTAIMVLGSVQLVCAFVGLCLFLWSKKHLVIDRTGQHPLKLINMVLKYSWKHKVPERRSAFTYWEEDIPRRIDLGKSKYGGPFTNEEVEDTKTFLRILLLLLSLVGFHLSGHGYSLLDQLMTTQCPSSLTISIVGDPMHLTFLTLLIGVPVYQFLIARCGNRYRPNMLKRMGLGLLCCLTSEIVNIVIHATMTKLNSSKYCNLVDAVPLVSCYLFQSKINVNGTCYNVAEVDHRYYCEFNNTPFLLLIIPSILQGLSILLVFMTALEFICAQAPLRLKGLLIGLWYASFAIQFLLFGIPEEFLSDPIVWEVFHEVKAFLIFISLMVYLCVSKRYHYRARDEIVNERFLVEEIFDRRFDLEEEHTRELEEQWRLLGISKDTRTFVYNSHETSRKYGTI